MATREIDEQQYAAQQQLTTLYQAMLAHPEARRLVHQATKKVNPNAVIPELDAKTEVMSEVEKIRSEFAAEKAEREAEKEQAAADKKVKEFADNWGRQRSSLARAGYTDQGIDAVEKFAEERGLPDLEAAAALFDRLNPPPEPAQPRGSGGWNLFDDTETDSDEAERQRLMEAKGDDDRSLNVLINKSLNDFRGGSRR
jgi:hypothetical protein